MKRTARNCIKVIADYNATIVAANPALALKPLHVLRTCQFSGASFIRPGVDPKAVAMMIFDGFSEELDATGGAGLKLVEFENGGHGFDCLPK